MFEQKGLGNEGTEAARLARLSTRKTSGRADFGAAVQYGSRTETARRPASNG
jgi:hypothetical protein